MYSTVKVYIDKRRENTVSVKMFLKFGIEMTTLPLIVIEFQLFFWHIFSEQTNQVLVHSEQFHLKKMMLDGVIVME